RLDGTGRLLVATLVAGTVVTALQALPLPIGIAHRLTPTAASDVVETARLLRADPPTWWALSASPAATMAQILAGLALTCMALAAGLVVGVAAATYAIHETLTYDLSRTSLDKLRLAA